MTGAFTQVLQVIRAHCLWTALIALFHKKPEVVYSQWVVPALNIVMDVAYMSGATSWRGLSWSGLRPSFLSNGGSAVEETGWSSLLFHTEPAFLNIWPFLLVNMNMWSLERLLAAWAAMSVLSSVSSYGELLSNKICFAVMGIGAHLELTELMWIIILYWFSFFFNSDVFSLPVPDCYWFVQSLMFTETARLLHICL